MNLCLNAAYRLKTYDKNGVQQYEKNPHTWNMLRSKYSIKEIKQFLITNALIIQYCGKCEYCLTVKKQRYKKRVRNQFKNSKYSYLITLTLDDDKIDSLLSNDQRDNILQYSNLSQFSNLSKIRVQNIIKNWKNKFNRYYNKKVDLKYFLCGEYGENTDRSHYHILLMCELPIPGLIKENVKGNHFKSWLIDSKQYSLYDIQPTNGNLSCSSYISKYITKSQDSTKLNYNVFEQEQIKYILSSGDNAEHSLVFNKQKHFIYYLNFFVNQPWYTYYYFVKMFNWDLIKLKPVTRQKPFIQQSQRLGISYDPLENINNGVMNRYYKSKIDKQLDHINYWLKDFNNTTLWFLKFYLQDCLLRYDHKRRLNIIQYFYQSNKKINEKYKNKDVF